jgi:2,3-bisphosphoglycerate-dependent phosphoglycerate mutase
VTQPLLLIRHASSVGQAPAAPLSPEGENQARALAPVLRKLRPTDLFSSPYARAFATLAPYALETDMAVRPIENLRERSLGPLDLPDWKDHIARSFDDATHAPPGGESLDDVHARALAAIEAILSQATGALPVAATHGGWISTVLHKIDPDFGFVGWQSLTNPDLILLTLDGSLPVAFRRLTRG